MACFIDEDSNFPTVGDIEDSSIGKLVYWHIPNVLSLPSSVDFGVDSPEFSFANAAWCLQMYPHGQRLFESENSVDLRVFRRESLVEVHEGSLKLGLKIARAAKLGDFAVGDNDSSSEDEDSSSAEDDFLIEPNRCVYSGTLSEYSSVVSRGGFVPPHDCLLVCCKLAADDNAGDIKQPVGVGSTAEDNQWFSIGDCDENPTVGLIKDYDLKPIEWSIPSFASVLRHAGLQSPRFSAAGATWCLRIRYCKEDEAAKVAIVRLHTEERRSQELSAKCEVEARFRKKCKTLKEAEFSAAVKRNNSELEMFTFECSQNFIQSRVSALAVCCAMRLRNAAVDDDQSEVETAGSNESVSKLLGDLKRLLLTSDGCDVTLLVKGQTFAAHSAILRARSSVFNSMLNCDMKEKRTGTVDIEDCDPRTFPDFLHFLYCGSVVNLSSENVFSLYRAADKYDVQDFKSQCVAFMQYSLSEDTFCDTVALSLQYGERGLLKMATEFFARNFQRIILTVQWQEFIVENPIQANELFIKALVPDGACKK